MPLNPSETPAPAGMSMIVKTVARWLKGPILLLGIYFTVYGHLEHSGGFADGVIIACSFILVFLAEGKTVENRLLSKNVAAGLSSLSALAFLCLASAGWFMGSGFFHNFLPTPVDRHFQLYSSGLVFFYNLCISLMVATTIFVIFVIFSAVKVTLPPGAHRDRALEDPEEL